MAMYLSTDMSTDIQDDTMPLTYIMKNIMRQNRREGPFEFSLKDFTSVLIAVIKNMVSNNARLISKFMKTDVLRELNMMTTIIRELANMPMLLTETSKIVHNGN